MLEMAKSQKPEAQSVHYSKLTDTLIHHCIIQGRLPLHMDRKMTTAILELSL